MGLLDYLPGDQDDRMAFYQGLASGDMSGSLMAGRERKLKRGLLDAQINETKAQAKERETKTQREEAAMQEQTRWRDLLQNAGRAPLGMGATGQVNGALPADLQIGAQPQIGGGQIDYTGLFQKGVPFEQVEQLAKTRNLGQNKVARTVSVPGPGGEKMLQQLDDYGAPVGKPMTEFEAAQMLNLGDRTVGVVPRAGMSFKMDMSPEGRDASARGWAAHGETKRHNGVTEANAGQGGKPAFHDGQWVFPPSAQNPQGGAVPVAGFTKPPKEPTEGERKAATLLQRMNGSQQQLRAALKSDPDAAKPGVFASGLRAIGADSLANTAATGSERQRVEAAQLDVLDAALTLGTGAAYTREQLEGYRKSYFPQIGDTKDNITDKTARLQNVIKAAEIAAGRAGGQVSGKPPTAAGPTPAAVNALKMNPRLRADFDAKFGQGSSAQILGN